MRKLLLFFTFFCMLAGTGFTDTFNYTGNTAEKIDPIGYEPGGYGALGGPMSNERQGLAQQFLVDFDTHMTALKMDAIVSPRIGATTFSYKLYLDSTYTIQGHLREKPVPDISSLVLTSEPITFATTMAEDIAGYNGYSREFKEEIPFDYTFKPGAYWLAEEGTGETYVSLSQDFVDPPIAPVAAPEPPAYLLYPIGAFLFFRRKLGIG